MTVPPGEKKDTASDASISLKSEGTDKPVKSVVGQFRQAGMSPFIKFYFDFPGAKSEVRVGDKRPVLLDCGGSSLRKTSSGESMACGT